MDIFLVFSKILLRNQKPDFASNQVLTATIYCTLCQIRVTTLLLRRQRSVNDNIYLGPICYCSLKFSRSYFLRHYLLLTGCYLQYLLYVEMIWHATTGKDSTLQLIKLQIDLQNPVKIIRVITFNLLQLQVNRIGVSNRIYLNLFC